MIEREGYRNVVAAALTLVMMVGHSPALAQEALPRVLVLTTGGTIAGGMPGQELVEAVPQLATIAEFTVEEFSRVGSSSITPAHWVGLARRINEGFREDPELQGVVVTHGTDSMEETSYFLHLTVKDERPVVVTGAMRGPNAVSADGPANLLSAMRVVTASEARGRGVLVVLNDEIHSARDVRKMDSNRVDAFQSPEWGAIGVVDSDTILIHRAALRIHTRSSRLELPTDSLPTVPIVADYPGSDGSTVRHWADRGVKGIVVQGFANGRTSPGTTRAVRALADSGVVVVLTSRVPEGRVMNRGDGLVIAAGDLPPYKARVLLALSLLRSSEADELRRIFATY